MTNERIAKAEADRSAQEFSIFRIEQKIIRPEQISAMSPHMAQVHLDKAKIIQAALMEIHTRIIHLKPDDLTPHEADFVSLNDRLETAMSTLLEILHRSTRSSSASRPPPTSTSYHMKLPEIQLPSFDGKFEDWPSFSDLFTATIDKNTSLSAAQKLQYLKSCVKNEPHNLIKSFIITDSNYSEAWTLLSSRYDNKREIIHSLIKKLLFQQSIKSESVAALQSLLNTTSECIRSLHVMGRPTAQWDDLLIVTIVEKMDPDTKAEWAKSLSGTDPTPYSELVTFLEKHIRSLLARGTIAAKVNNQQNSQKNNFNNKGSKQVSTHHVSATLQCQICKETHFLYQCKKFKDMNPTTRRSAIKKTTLCWNCFRDGHTSETCGSPHRCKKCSEKHNTMLHQYKNETASSATSGSTNVDSSTSNGASAEIRTACALANSQISTVLLKTAVVNIKDTFGNMQPCRLLLDDGSEASCITEECLSALGLAREETDVQITGISGAHAARAKWKSTARLESRVHDANVDVELLVLSKVTGTLPRVTCDSRQWSHIADLQLADPTFNQPGSIDILLGADVVASIMRDGRRQGPANSPIAMNSIFGWVLSGKVHIGNQPMIRMHHASTQLEELVHRFWQVQEVPPRKPFTPEEAACEEFFNTTTTRDNSGRYTVRLPFREKYSSNIFSKIGNTRTLAERRLYQLERRFTKYPSHHKSYIEFMKEYLELGHMEPAEPSPTAVFIPHHFVLKEDSSTTKLRVVFDASMKGSNSLSLNDTLMIGPTIQDDLQSLLIRFRFHPIALKADVAKMYRQFEVHHADRDFQRILWREDRSKPIQEYRLKTVTYGTASAPYLATRCLIKLAEDEQENFPHATAVMKSDMYVDDLLSGESSTQAAIKLSKELISVITTGGMSIRKWCSNDPDVMAAIPEELRETGSEMEFDEDASIKALGVTWQPSSDTFNFKVKSNPIAKTKRDLLSEIAKTFDPLGWLSPYTIKAKILFQQLWQLSIDWDETMDEEHQNKWSEYQEELQTLSTIQIPRCIVQSSVIDYQLHAFSDASEKAYAAALYLRTVSSGGVISVHLLTSRTKVAPLRQVSLPRLELCGAVLLAETVDFMQQAIKVKCSLYCYTDSMIVLKWLSSTSRRWKTFVANRVAAIQDIIPTESWHHVRSEDNPADLPSRGVPAEDLINSNLWWNGPSWLSTPQFPMTNDQVDMMEVQKEERAKVVLTHHVASVEPTQPFIVTWTQRFSSFNKLLSATATFQSFMSFLKDKHEKKLISKNEYELNPCARKKALESIIRQIQAISFAKEVDNLKKNNEVLVSSSLRILYPRLDYSGILRVGGRLQHAAVTEDQRHPVILPKKFHFTNLVISHFHHSVLHGGINLTLAALRQEYWIIGARDMVRFVITNCFFCKKTKADSQGQLMGQLPASRVTPSRPFLHTGVDLAGPFYIRMRKGRGAPQDKCYFVVYVCFVTKAVFLDVVTDLTTSAFMASLDRFMSRRGYCSHIYSDCGKNFVGAERELRRRLQATEREVKHKLSELGVTWHFNPPAAPHQGGLWEAAVKSAKYHIKRIMGNSTLTLLQFQTLLCNVESCLNSRPLTPISCDPTDFSALTPGHFLVGAPLKSLPVPNLQMVKQNRLDHWQQVQQLSQHFWTRWSKEYLSTLQPMGKWTRKRPNVQVGDLAIVKEDCQIPNQWKLARIIAVHPGADGLVRKVTLRTVLDATTTPIKYGELTRPIQKISILINSNEMK